MGYGYGYEQKVNTDCWNVFKQCLDMPNTEDGWQKVRDMMQSVINKHGKDPFAAAIMNAYYSRLEVRHGIKFDGRST